MRVAFYNHTAVVSGAEISMLLTANHLTIAEPILFSPEGELTDRARALGMQVIPIQGYRARKSRNPFLLARDIFGMVAEGYRFARTIRKHSIDLIHANSLRAGMMAALFGWLHRRPLIWHIRDIPPQGMMGAIISRLATRTVKAIIGISMPVVQAFHLKSLSDRLHLVHNGVELRYFSPQEKQHWRRELRSEWDIPMESKLNLIIGQIAPWKRQEDAIHATHLLVQQGHDAYLCVVGEPKFGAACNEYRDKLYSLVKKWELEDRVRFLGHRNDVMEICCAADLLFLCSDQEPFGRVIIEAMSQSLPVIATRAGGVPEIITHVDDGMLYEVGDTNQLRELAAMLYEDHILMQSIGERAERRVHEAFSIQHTVSRVEQVYRTIMNQQALEVPVRAGGQSYEQ
ncbi:MAG: glycosyltransferase [Candidatus Cohnella colombiensis]|uniref:Glycosyltransferase n=1 Tax=Candidatus Cohnella colombiensis TaxID=3121368 RepID=A0AA95EXY4_9BACL|nr:MAG: glycosyltransferase [Cohnella sp.]